jgi:hypothetical protein
VLVDLILNPHPKKMDLDEENEKKFRDKEMYMGSKKVKRALVSKLFTQMF